MSYESVNKIKSLQQGIETVTGESYGDLTTAVQALKNGYGSSGVVDSGDCGENVVWTLYDTGELIISGTGAMFDYATAGDSPIYGYVSDIKRVVIENGVTTIETFFFCECEELTSVIIPDSVTFISHGAFLYCPKLTSITIGKGVTTIDKNVFSACGNLSSVTIHKGVVSIGARAFNECVKLTDVYYEGTKSEWEGIAIGDGNDCLLNATLHCEYEDNSSKYDEGYEAGKLDGYSEGYTASQNARQEKPITQNGEYTPDEGYSGFSKVTVNVTDVDTVDGWHVAVRDDGTAPPSGTINTITFVYGG